MLANDRRHQPSSAVVIPGPTNDRISTFGRNPTYGHFSGSREAIASDRLRAVHLYKYPGSIGAYVNSEHSCV